MISIDPVNFSKLKTRDPAYLSEIFSQVNPSLIRYLMSQKIYDEKAEELVQQTWERFFTNMDKFEGNSKISSFVIGILVNKIHEFRRASGKFVPEEDIENLMDARFTADGWWANEVKDPSRILESKQTGAKIIECLEGLTENQKAAFLMVEVEEENSDEICNVLKISVSNLRVLLFRAKEKLKLCIEGQVDAI